MIDFPDNPSVGATHQQAGKTWEYTSNNTWKLSATTGGSILWSQINGKPAVFAPEDHTHNLGDIESSGASLGQVVAWNGSNWAPTTRDGIVSQNATQILQISNTGQLNYQDSTNAVKIYNLPSTAGLLGLRGGDITFSNIAPTNPYPGLRWLDSSTGKAYDWYTWTSGTGVTYGAWVEFSGASGAGGGSSTGTVSGTIDWGNVTSKPSTFTPSTHGHSTTEISGLATVATSGSWEDLSNKPSSFAPSTHSHSIANVTGLTAELDNRHTKSQITTLLNGKQAAGNYSTQGHTHDISQITGIIPADRIAVLPTSAPPVLLSQTIEQITSAEEAQISQGSIVISSDGKRYIYKGTGSKSATASYIELADIMPQWAAVQGKPALFEPSSHFHPVSDILQFETAVQTIIQNNPSNAAVTLQNNSGLTYFGTELSTLYNTTVGDNVSSTAVGGAISKKASVWKNLTIVQVLDEILFPTVLPKVKTAKSVSLEVTGSTGTILEIGTSYARKLTATFDQGLIENGDGTNGPALVGAATKYTFSGTGIATPVAQTGASSNEYSFTAAIVEGSNSWTVTVEHGAGTGNYYDNKNNIASNLTRTAGPPATLPTSTTTSITGVYPYFYMKSTNLLDIDGFVQAIQSQSSGVTRVIASSTGALLLPYSLVDEYFYVAYPVSSGLKTKYATHTQTTNAATATDTGAITFVFNTHQQRTIVKTVAGAQLWSGAYYIHIAAGKATNANSYITLNT